MQICRLSDDAIITLTFLIRFYIWFRLNICIGKIKIIISFGIGRKIQYKYSENKVLILILILLKQIYNKFLFDNIIIPYKRHCIIGERTGIWASNHAVSPVNRQYSFIIVGISILNCKTNKASPKHETNSR